MFLGVSDESKGYRLYDPITKQVIISKDVVFEEEESWDWSSTEKESTLKVLEIDTSGIKEYTEEETIPNVSGSSNSSNSIHNNNSSDSIPTEENLGDA